MKKTDRADRIIARLHRTKRCCLYCRGWKACPCPAEESPHIGECPSSKHTTFWFMHCEKFAKKPLDARRKSA